MNPSSNEQIAQLLLDGAKKRGIPDAKAQVSESRSVSVLYRKGRPDRVEESSRRSVSISLYDNGRYSASSSNDFREDALRTFLDNAAAMTRAMEPDPFRCITDPALYENRQDLDLKLFDPAVDGFSDRQRHELAARAEAAAIEAAGEAFISAEAGVETSSSSAVQLHSNGFSGAVKGTDIWVYAEVSLKDDGDRRPSGYDLCGARFAADLGSPAAVGRGAAHRGMLKVGQSKVETRRCPMIVENRAAGRLLGGFLGAAYGRSLQQKRSFLEGMEGQKAGSPLFSLVDDPFIEKGFGSTLFDGEGISARRRDVVEEGVLRTFFIDTYYGKKLNRPPTTGDSSNLVFATGNRTPDELVASLAQGILVRGFIGGNTNSTTGDFSLGVFGTLIENGRLTRPVSELNISGNHRDLWHRLSGAGNDPWIYSTTRCPSLLFDDIQFSGN